MKAFSLSIPEPCHENWNSMTPQDRGRFCGSCQKTVVDFTTMSDRQMADFFKTPPASVCGRFHADQLNRNIEPPRKRIPWIKYFFQFTWPAFVLSLKSCDEREAVVGKLSRVRPLEMTENFAKPQTRSFLLEEDQVDTTELTGDTIKIESIKTKGSKLTPLAAYPQQHEKSYQKHRKRSQAAAIISNSVEAVSDDAPVVAPVVVKEISETNFTGGLQGWLGVVVVGKKIEVKDASEKKISNDVKSEISAAFNVFPNPVMNNSTIIIKSIALPEGVYAVSILTTVGAMVQNGSVTISFKNAVQFSLKLLPTGIYVLRLTSTKTNITYSQQLSVQ